MLEALADPGGAAGARHPTGSISFVFTEKCMRPRSAPPQLEILDPPLGRVMDP